MRLKLSVLISLLVLWALPAVAFGVQREKAPSEGYIVVYDRSVDDVDAETHQRERSDGFRSRFRYRRVIEGFAAKLSAAQVKELRRDPEVAYVSPDRVVEASAFVPLASGESAPTGVARMEAATTASTRQASAASVAVIDTGVDLSHPDLNVLDGTNCVNPGAPANDDNGHGTHVAGTIAAKNTGSGVVGVAPGTRLYAVKVLDAAGSGTWSQIICGIDWVSAHNATAPEGIRVANMSLGGAGDPVGSCATTTDPLHKAICRSTAAGITYTVAAGNEGWDFDYASVPDVPAAYPEVLTVTAMSDSDGQPAGAGPAPACRTAERDEQYASFSSFALTSAGKAHTVAAPGTCITSTWQGGGYATISGTSMAAPHVAGAVALCLGEGATSGPCTGLTPAQIVQRMRTDADTHTNADLGYGFIGDPRHPISTRYYGYLTWVGTSTSRYPLATSILTGTLRSGNYARLGNDDDSYYEVNSNTSYNRTASWYGRFTGVPGSLRELRISYRARHSRACSQSIFIYRWTDARWVAVDTRSVGTTETGTSVAPGGTLASYVSTTGELRARVSCSTTAGTFYTSSDLLRINYQQ